MTSQKPTFAARLLSEDIKKPTSLVHFERILSPLEQKIMTLMLFSAQYSESRGKDVYSLNARFVKDFVGWEDSNNYQAIYDAFRRIKKTDLNWNVLGKDATVKSELICSLVITLAIEPGSGEIRFKFHPDLVRLIRDPNVFAKLKLIMISVLATPKHAYPIYELIADAYCRRDVPFRIPYRKLLTFLGLAGSAYPDDWKSFKKRILRPCLEQIDRHSDYNVSYTIYRDGRKVGGVDFEIQKKKAWQPPLLLEPLRALEKYLGRSPFQLPEKEPKEYANLHAKFAPFKINRRTIEQAIERFGEEGVEEIRQYVLKEEIKRKLGSNPIEDVTAYMAQCLREGHGVKTRQERDKQVKRDNAREQKREDAERKRLKEKAREGRERKTQQFIDSLSPDELQTYRSDFENAVREGRMSEIVRLAFEAQGWEMPAIQKHFRTFVVSERNKVESNVTIRREEG